MIGKNSRLFAVVFCCMFATIAASAKDIFAELKKMPDVESVHVNGFMMSVARSAVRMSAGKDAGQALEVLKGIKSMDVIACENAGAIPSARELVRKIIDSEGYEVALEAKEKDEAAVIYCQPSKNDSGSGKLKNVVIEVTEPKEYSVIIINGTIDSETFTLSAIK